MSLEFKEKLTVAEAREALPLKDAEPLRKFDEDMRKNSAGPARPRGAAGADDVHVRIQDHLCAEYRTQ